ncbi:hypothetical protein [Cupriavidus sp. D39]|uniref:hypothetical protein n=1 Tax=Cupriavidus sp. D39 TaxID=2997877 RepID=UPI00226FF98A|nr:hypothetical protein [Cupriavidus sp. D39]MCY0853322.1 hypothetical protein [Cupriavidus sp. D39]
MVESTGNEDPELEHFLDRSAPVMTEGGSFRGKAIITGRARGSNWATGAFRKRMYALGHVYPYDSVAVTR